MDELTPIYRIEFFLDAIVNNSVNPLTPQFRVEYYLAKIAGESVEIPAPAYRMEKYLAKLCGEDVELPTPEFRIEFYLAKLCGMDVEVPEPIYRVEYWLWNWCGGGGIEKTVTGNPIHITDALAKPVQALSIALEPIQDLHGYDNPWPSGGGKNKLPKSTYTSGTVNGTTITVNNDGSITISGTPSAQVRANIYSGMFWTAEKVQIFSCGTMAANTRIFCARERGGSTNYPTISPTSTAQVGDVFSNMLLEINTTYDGTPFTIYPMIEDGSIATTWQPYSNLCPISGWTGCDVWHCGQDLIYPSEFQQGSIGGNGTSTGSSTRVRSKYIAVKPNTQYAFEINSELQIYELHEYVSDGGTNIKYTTVNASTATLTTSATTNYLRILARYSNNATITPSAVTGIQMCEGSTTNLVKIPLSWSSHGTQYGGYVDLVSGEVWANRATIKASSITAWTGYAALTDETGGYVYKANAFGGVDVRTLDVISDSYKRVVVANWEQMTYGEFLATKYLIVSVPPSVTDKTAAVTYFSNNDAEFVYELETPVLVTTLSATEVTLLAGENNLWSNANSDLSLTYLADGNASDAEALNILLGNRYVNNHTEDEPTDREALQILLGGNK